MPRPCSCEKCSRDGPYDIKQCRLCWLYHNDVAYKNLWDAQPQDKNPRKVLLINKNACGDALVMTAAIESLHITYKDRFLTGAMSSCNAVFENNPFITKFDDMSDVEEIEINYPEIDICTTKPTHFMQAYCADLGKKLGVKLDCVVRKPSIYLSEQEMAYISRVHEITGKPTKHWLVSCGYKRDYPIKGLSREITQEVIDYFYKKGITWVQIGDERDVHHLLKNTINQIGKTSVRELIRLVGTSSFMLCGITFPYWLAGALEKPCVCVAGGREPAWWLQLPTAKILGTEGQLSCCRTRACWKNAIVQDEKGRKDHELCEQPVFGDQVLPKCITMISSGQIIREIENFIYGGVISL